MPTVRYFAAARAAAGVAEERVDADTLDELLDELSRRHGERLALVLKSCSFLIDGLACRDGSRAVPAQSTVDILPPFAGG
ncbi:molybdopterin synthase subunit MoaD2 [Rugosimonospora acidiphila]|uniref:Molybdopterin synthase sulfur carrier subunit n=1 Tax=Rugosimonospora acidiphila TaxID=556531 RepID=A0ABP9S132_9ACTN